MAKKRDAGEKLAKKKLTRESRLLDFIEAADAVSLKQAFDDRAMEKVSSDLECMKVEVAQNYFNKPELTTEEVEQVDEVSAKAKRKHAAERAEIERDYRQRPMTSSPKYKKDGTKTRDMWDGRYEEGRSKKRTPSGGMGGGTG